MDENMRNYEVSIWTLQDNFLTVLKHFNTENKGRIQNPDFQMKNDGTLIFSFSLPMYLYDGIERKENPIWFNARNGNLIADLRKIKIIFNKNETDEKVFELLIVKVTEEHEGFELTCKVECEGLAFHELGKTGYKLSLNEDTYLDDWDNWAAQDGTIQTEPRSNINYWCDKVFENTNWSYEIQMDWSAYDGQIVNDYALMTQAQRILLNNQRESLGLRRYDKIYEDAYTSSWADNNGVLIPTSHVNQKEKERLIEVEESNRYNIVQTIAETFGVFCNFIYEHDNNYCITARKVVFYNNFIQEEEGNIDINYGYDSTNISREMDSKDVVTKMFVKTLEDNNTESGLATIMDTEANRSQEDYLLNFDYLYLVGNITEEQYNEIKKYELKLHNINQNIKIDENQLINLENQKNEASAAETVAKNAIALDTERIGATNNLFNSITNGESKVSITDARPDYCYLLEDNGSYYINLRQKGIIPNTLHIYTNYTSKTSPSGSGSLTGLVSSYTLSYDEFGNLVKVIFSSQVASSVYLTYDYIPQLYYDNIRKVWESRLFKDTDKYNLEHENVEKINTLIDTIKADCDDLLDEKKLIISRFERLMGAAIREGYWQPDDIYSKYGDKHNESLNLTASSIFSSNLASIGWDNELFDEEDTLTYEIGADQQLQYYPCINLSNNLTTIAQYGENFSELSFIFQSTNLLPSGVSTDDVRYLQFFSIGSQSLLKFIRPKSGGAVIPVLMLTGAKSLADINLIYNNPRIGVLTTEVTNGSVTSNIETVISSINFVNNLNNYEIVYPRIKINSANLKNNEEELVIKCNNNKLEVYEDYYVLGRKDLLTNNNYNYNNYITIKSEYIFKQGGLNNNFKCIYTLSNAGLIMYLDAIQVLKENAYPRVSYTITPIGKNLDSIKNGYKYLNRITSINDDELKFTNVQGYISEIHLDLDYPENDQFTITNYKTKFEDLFSSIVVQTEEMKKNSTLIGMAANAFTATGEFKSDMIQSVMNRVDLNYAFNQGTLTINEEDGIWGTSDSGVVAFRGGGIFTATEKDSNGDWVWNTGILPSGINASLITTGQLDTNLIRVYAGDDLKFQLNGNGLYAYKSWWDDPNISEAGSGLTNDGLDLRQYVVHNSEGLFLVAEKGTVLNGQTLTQDIDRVEISWDGLIIRDLGNEKVFYADTNGNLHLTGAITATSLSIVNNGSTQSIDNYIAENVDIGGRNLFIGTQDFSNTNSQWIRLNTGWTVSSSTYGGCKIASKSVYWNCMSQKVTVEAGETYTWSAWMKADSTQQIRFLSYREETTGHCTVDSYPSGIFATIGTEWKRVAFTVKIANGGIAEPGADVQNNGVTWYICGIKFERGNVATDWSLAPEDVNSDFESVRTELSLVPGKITAAVDSIKIGGANLYVDTRNYTYLHSSNTPWLYSTNWWMSSLTYNGCKVIGKTSPWQGVRQRIHVEAGKQYTFSAWVKATALTTIRSSVSSTVDDCTVTPAHDSFTFVIGTDWQRVSYTFTVTRAGNAEPTLQAQFDNVTLYICGIKFEEGNKATYWTESDKDLRTETTAELSILEESISSKVSQTDFNALGERVSNAESTISQTPEQIELAVNAVKIGGTNLFTGTKDFTDDGQWTRLASWTINRASTNTYNDCVIAQKSVNWNCMSQKVWVEAGAEYTYSMWIKAASTQTVQWLFYRSETTNHCTVEGANTGTISGIGTAWQRISFTKTVATSGWAEPGIDVQNNGVTWYVCGIKFERGNKATDWSEAQGEVYAGTTVKITKDEFNVSTPKFGVNIMNSSEHFTLDGNGGTMDTLTVNGDLKSNNVAYRYTGPASVTIGPSGTYKSLAEFANAINNKVLPSKDSVSVVLTADQTGTIYLGGMSGMGGVIIYGNGYSFNGALTIAGTSCYMWIEGLTVSGDLTLNRCRFVRLDNMMFNKSSLALTNGTTCMARKCQWANTNTCFSISYSRMIAWKCRGGNSNGTCIWGVGSIVQWDTASSDSSPWQSGESTNMRPQGVINLTASLTVPSDLTNGVTPTSLNGTTPSPPATITTTSFNCKASKTAYDGTHWHESDNRIRQGFYTMTVGNYEQYGCLWFDTSALSGKTILNAWLTLTRISGYGRSSEVNVHLWTTPLTSAGNNNNPTTNAVDYGVIGTIGNGETKQFTIPVAAISASANKGFMLRVDDGALISGRSYSTNYAHFYSYGETTPPVLTVTYR